MITFIIIIISRQKIINTDIVVRDTGCFAIHDREFKVYYKIESTCKYV